MLPKALNSFFLLLILDFIHIRFSTGFKINIESRTFSPHSPELRDVLNLKRLRRDVGSDSSAGGESSLNDLANTQYLTNVTVGGTEFQVIIDTGRWVAFWAEDVVDTEIFG